MTKRNKKPKPSPMLERVMTRLQEGVSLADVAAEVGMNETILASLLECEIEKKRQAAPPPAPAQKPTLGRRKPVFLPNGQRLGRSALWS